MFRPADLLDLSQTEHAALFEGCANVWEALARIKAYLEAGLKPRLLNQCDGVAWIGERVFIGEGTVVEDGAMIQGPAWIGRNCKIRHNAYLRENVIVGDGCVVGNSSELKNSILFNGAQAPHFNYVGDSILGHKAHLGAGAVLSNVKLARGNVSVQAPGGPIETGLRKFGAILGDRAEVGCNAVLSPGSILGRDSVVYPAVHWRGVLPEGSLAKNKSPVEVSPRQKHD